MLPGASILFHCADLGQVSSRLVRDAACLHPPPHPFTQTPGSEVYQDRGGGAPCLALTQEGRTWPETLPSFTLGGFWGGIAMPLSQGPSSGHLTYRLGCRCGYGGQVSTSWGLRVLGACCWRIPLAVSWKVWLPLPGVLSLEATTDLGLWEQGWPSSARQGLGRGACGRWSCRL